VAAEDNSLATAQETSVAGTMEDDADQAPASTAAQGVKTLMPVDIDADDHASMEDSVYNPSSSSSLEDPQLSLCRSFGGHGNGPL